MISPRLRSRAQRGTTLTEVVISSGILVMLLAFGVPVFKSVADAGGEGAARLTAQAENQEGLLSIATELQNSSTTATDALGNARLSIAAGTAPEPLFDWRQKDMGGFKGTLGQFTDGFDKGQGTWTAPGTVADPYANTVDNSVERFTQNDPDGLGSGARGGSQWGRVRSDTKLGAAGYGGAAVRPRWANIATNSELTFQKVSGYTVGADGAPVVTWSTPITFRVENGKLVRVQDGQTRVVAPFTVGFRAALTDAGTVVVTIISQKRNNTNGAITFQANQIEVSPKN